MRDLSLMTWKEVQAADKGKSIVFAVMAPIEEHGWCLPLATDLLEGVYWSKGAMKKLEQRLEAECFYLPPFPVAAASVNEFYGSIHFSMKDTCRIAYGVVESIQCMGFKHIVVIASHADPQHQIAIEKAVRKANARNGLSSYIYLCRCECDRNLLQKIDVSNCAVLVDLVSNLERKSAKNYDYWSRTEIIQGTGIYLTTDTDVEVTAGTYTSMPLSSPEELIKAFITRCYRLILNRDPDPAGLNTWLNELTSRRKTAAEIIEQFMNSPGFKGKGHSAGDTVNILYQAMLGRNADAGGKANWVLKLQSGQTLAHVINGFCFSKEFRGLCDSYGIKAGFVNIENTDTTAEGKIKAFVQRCYRIILDREADPSGMQTWYEQLSSGKKAASEIIDRFVNSPEFSGKNYNSSDSVEILYKAMLGRGSDAAGKANWVGKLDAGQPFAVVINGFCVSKEFTGICASYGIKPGSVTITPLSGMAEEEALSMLAYKAKAPITKKSETNPTRVEIINPSDTIDMNIGTAVQAVYINEEKAKEFISRCYLCILGREASAAELANWIRQMTNGTKTPDQIARGFLFSNEFKGKNLNNETVVKILYKVYMNRDADPEGLKTWTEKLDGGTSLNDLLNTFAKTNEFKKVVSEMSK